MNQQSARMALRAAVLMSAFLALIGTVIYLTGDGLLPKELADWEAAQKSGDEAGAIFVFFFAIPAIGVLVASLVGLFMLKKWGAWLYLAFQLIGSVVMLAGPNVESGLLAFISSLDTLLGGAILGIAFFSSALEPDQYS
jgi:hypothetical protein